MSVIIRLQHLPWSASAADVRQFFRGLAIPEGGVHIVGGDLGDTFIAFSSDEDARQAMAMDGQLLAGARVKLLLSSRTEMQKIIEQARQQALQAMAATSSYPSVQPAQTTSHAYVPQAPQVPAVPAAVNYSPKAYQEPPYEQGYGNAPRFGGPANGGPAPYTSPHQGPHQQTYPNAEVPYANAPYGGLGRHVTGPLPQDNRPYPGRLAEPVAERRGSREIQERGMNGRPDMREKDGRRERRRSRERDRGPREGSRERRRGKRSRSRSRSRDRNRPRRRSTSKERKTSKDERSSGPKTRPGPDVDSKNGSSRDSCNAVQFRMLSGDLTYKDIREFFHGIRVSSVGIKMINGVDGYRFGFAYISFTQRRDKQEALDRSGSFIRESPVQIVPVEDSVFEEAMDSYSPGVDLGNYSFENSCFVLRDVPLDVTEVEVAKAFQNFMVSNIVPELDSQGVPTGIWYVQLSSDAEYRRALQLFVNGFYIRGIRIKIAFLPIEELNPWIRAKPQGVKKPLRGKHQEEANAASFRQADNQFRPQPMESGVKRVNISGLPPTALERDVVDFFSDAGAIPRFIQIKTDAKGVPTGEATCEFSSFAEAQKAQSKNGSFMAGRTVTVALDAETPVPRITSPKSEEQPDYRPPPGPRGPRPPVRPTSADGPYGGPRPRPQRFSGPPRFPPMNPQGNFQRPRQPTWPVHPPAGPEMPVDPAMAGPPMRMPMGGGMPPDMGMPGPMPMAMGPGPMPPGPMPPGPVAGFGAPGCVVSLSNVPYKATMQDILHFFEGFPITDKCIIRRFSNTGHPTGDARVALPTPMDAQRAVQMLQGAYILDRSITLAIV